MLQVAQPPHGLVVALLAQTVPPFWVAFFQNVDGAVAGLVGIEGGVVSGVFNLESSGVEAPDWRPRHDKQYHEVRSLAP